MVQQKYMFFQTWWMIVINNRDYNIDQINRDYDFGHNRAALVPAYLSACFYPGLQSHSIGQRVGEPTQACFLVSTSYYSPWYSSCCHWPTSYRPWCSTGHGYVWQSSVLVQRFPCNQSKSRELSASPSSGWPSPSKAGFWALYMQSLWFQGSLNPCTL